MSYILHDEGLVDCSTGQTYQYYLKDHLGNVRSVFKSNGSTAQLEQEQQYYPFGMEIGGLSYSNSTLNRYKYNGKEYQEEVDWYDYGARMYDAQLGRWHCIDPLAESYYSQSSYHFSGNNPINMIDDNGMSYGSVYDVDYNFLGFNEEGLWGDAYVMPQDQFLSGMSIFHSDLVGTAYNEMNRWEKWQFDGAALGHWNEMIYDATAMTYPKHDWELAFADATIGMLGGASEFILGLSSEYLSGTSSSIVSVPMMVDGGARFLSGAAKMGFLFSNDYRNATALPGNLGGWFGKGGDMLIGRSYYDYGVGQGVGTILNDAISFSFGGGSGLGFFINSPTIGLGFNYLNSTGGFMYSGYQTGKSMQHRNR